MDGSDGKLTMRESTRLIEDHRIDLRQHVHIVGSLDEDSFSRSPTNTTKECQRHADHQGTGTRDHEEHQGAIQPCGESGEG